MRGGAFFIQPADSFSRLNVCLNKKMKGSAMSSFWSGFVAGILSPLVFSCLVLSFLVLRDQWNHRKPHWMFGLAADSDGEIPVCSKCLQAIRFDHRQHEKECWKVGER